MIKIESKADRIAMWFLLVVGMVQVFLFTVGIGYGFMGEILGH